MVFQTILRWYILANRRKEHDEKSLQMLAREGAK